MILAQCRKQLIQFVLRVCTFSEAGKEMFVLVAVVQQEFAGKKGGYCVSGVAIRPTGVCEPHQRITHKTLATMVCRDIIERLVQQRHGKILDDRSLFPGIWLRRVRDGHETQPALLRMDTHCAAASRPL